MVQQGNADNRINQDVTRQVRSVRDDNDQDTANNEGHTGIETENCDCFFTYLINAVRNKTVHKMRSEAPIRMFKQYCELFLPILVGKHHWKINHTAIGVRTLTTVADEALLALILENNIEEWTVLARGGEIQGKQRLTLYTHGGPDAKGTRKGWSVEGLKRYNTLHKEIKKDRTGSTADFIDNKLKDLWKAKADKKGLRVAVIDDVSQQTAEDVIEPVFDFDD